MKLASKPSLNNKIITSYKTGNIIELNLRSFYFSYNLNLDQFPFQSPEFDNVVSVDIGVNQLKVIPQKLQYLTKLRVLNLKDNPLESIPKWISKFDNLLSLDLWVNWDKLKDLPIYFPRNIIEMKFLHIIITNRPIIIEDITDTELIEFKRNLQIKQSGIQNNSVKYNYIELISN